MKKLICIIPVFVILLTGCSPSIYDRIRALNEASRDQCQSFEGKPVEIIYKTWGAPDNVYHDGQYKVLQYKSSYRLDYIGKTLVQGRDVFVQDGIIKICRYKGALR